MPSQVNPADPKYKSIQRFILGNLLTPLALLPVTIYLFLNDSAPFPHIGVLVMSLFTLWLFPIAVKFSPRFYAALVFLSLQTVTFTVLWGAFHYGGITSPFLILAPMIPLLSFYFLGSGLQNKIVVFSQILISFTMFFFHVSGSDNIPVSLPLTGLIDLGLLVTFSTLVCGYFLGIYFSSAVDTRVKLEKDLRKYEVALTRLTDEKDDAERANSAKSEFLAKMSHELRTPLNAVLGYSEILLEDAEADGRTEEIADLQKISGAGKHLLAMVNDILDISKIEAGKVELYLETISLDKFIKEVEATARPLAAKNDNSFALDKGDDLGDITVDVTKLRQSVLNLLSNASKFTESGHISMSVARAVRENQDWISISVQDTGVGISEDNMKNLFRNFSQANASITANFGGTGLGLSLSQNLCQMMGGKISLESELGKGSCFTIHLPAVVEESEEIEHLAALPNSTTENLDNQDEGVVGNESGTLVRNQGALPADTLDDEELSARSLDKAIGELRKVHASAQPVINHVEAASSNGEFNKVLIIDDDRDFLEFAERMLYRDGYTPISTDAPETVLQMAMTVNPDVILLDVLMPSLDGWDVLATLKEEAATAHIPVIMISNVIDGRTARIHNAAGYIEKPLDSKKLDLILRSFKSDDDALAV